MPEFLGEVRRSIDGIKDAFRVRAACDMLQMPPRMARVMVHVHNLTKAGQEPDALSLKPGETAEKKLGPLSALAKRDSRLGEELRDAQRLFADERFRSAMVEVYEQYVLPQVRKKGSVNIVKALSLNMEQYRREFEEDSRSGH